MTWIKDFNEIMVNIDKWDFLNFITFEDKTTGKCIASKFYLEDKDGSNHVLGYLRVGADDGEIIIQQITLGYQPSFDCLINIIYFNIDNGFCAPDLEYEDEMEKIQELIGVRFIESD